MRSTFGVLSDSIGGAARYGLADAEEGPFGDGEFAFGVGDAPVSDDFFGPEGLHEGAFSDLCLDGPACDKADSVVNFHQFLDRLHAAQFDVVGQGEFVLAQKLIDLLKSLTASIV